MIDTVKVGSNVKTIGGIYGKIVAIKEDLVTIETGPEKAKIVFSKSAIATIEKMDVDPDLSLDCEYNRNGCLNKALPSFTRGVIPDVIIHKRGSNDKNVLVMEFKTYWNDKQENDEDKIIELTDQQGVYKYAYGMTVLIGRGEPIIKLFVDGKEIEI